MAEPEVVVPEDDKPKKSKKKLIIIGAVVGVLVIGGAGFLVLGGGGGGGAETEAAVTTTTEAPIGTVIEGDTLTVNLADSGDPRYARVTFAVVLPNGTDSGTVGERMALLKDQAIDILAGTTSSGLLGDGGLDSLRTDLTAAALEIYPDGEVLRVVLTEVLVQ